MHWKVFFVFVVAFNLNAVAQFHESPPSLSPDPGNQEFEKKLQTQLDEWVRVNEPILSKFSSLKEKQQTELNLELRYFIPREVLRVVPIRTRIVPVDGRAHQGGYFLILKENPNRAGDDYGQFIFDSSTMKVSKKLVPTDCQYLKTNSGKLMLITNPSKKPVTLFFGIENLRVTSDPKSLNQIKVTNDAGESFEINYDSKSKTWSEPILQR